MKTYVRWAVLLLCLTACRQVTDVRQLDWMLGKCLKFNASIPVVLSRGDRIASRHVVPSADPREVVADLPAGTVARISRVVYEENVDYTRVEIIAVVGGKQYAVTHLFETEWINAARRDLDERRSLAAPVLRSRYSGWISCVVQPDP